MIGIQKERLVSLNLLTVQKLGLHHYKGKQMGFFFDATLSWFSSVWATLFAQNYPDTFYVTLICQEPIN
jgi:hypothetical protein